MTKPVPTSSQPNVPATASWDLRHFLSATIAAPTAISPKPDRVPGGNPGPIDITSETDLPATNETDIDPSPNLPQIPGYKILRKVGGGGMGTVFKAKHLVLNKVVALKLINNGWGSDEEFRERFDREAKTLAALDHENVVPVYDAGSWQGLPYLTMKFVDNKTLYHRLEAVRSDPRVAAKLLAKVAHAVHYLHGQGIIHRDLKPLNILLTADGTPLVADFGLVRPIEDDSHLSISLVPLGTRQYMSPEQTRGGRGNYTPACDIWALGVILYELLTGHRPFGHEDPLELFAQIRCGPVPPVAADHNAPPGLEAIARRCLQKNPADRYATAEAVAADLERWLRAEPLQATVNLPESQKKSCRTRVLLAAGVGAMLALAVAAASGLFNPRRDTDTNAPDKLAVSPIIAAIPARSTGPTAITRFNAGEDIVLTDDKGKPTGGIPLTVKGHEVGTREQVRGEYHAFSAPSTTSGLIPLSEELFPVPFKVTGEVAINAGTDGSSVVAVYVGRKRWRGGAVPHESLVWFGTGIGSEFDLKTNKPQPAKPLLLCRSGLYWWAPDIAHSDERFDQKAIPLQQPDGKKAAVLRFDPVEIKVYADRIVSTVAGVELKAATSQEVIKSLSSKPRDHPTIGPYAFAAPVFESGIGLYIREADGIVTNLTVSKINP